MYFLLFIFSVLCRLFMGLFVGRRLCPSFSGPPISNPIPRFPDSILLELVSHAFGLPPPGVKSNYERFMTAGQLHSMSINLATLNWVSFF